MAEKTPIAWADSTFNAWIGCNAISPGCDHCYAEAYAKRVGRDFAARTHTSPGYWKDPLKWNEKAKATGKPWRVFCNSLADVFDNEAPAEWRLELGHLICQTPRLTWMLLTKRIGNASMALRDFNWTHFPRNVWLGATVVTQEEADRDIPKLLELRADVKFISVEPQLGRVDLAEHLGMYWNSTMNAWEGTCSRFNPRGLGWVICGGESGPKARPFDVEWPRVLRRECAVAGVPFFMKQLGAHTIWRGCSSPGEQWPPHTFKNDTGRGHFRVHLKDRAGADPVEWPEDLRVQDFPT